MQMTTKDFLETAYLTSDRIGRVRIKAYLPPSRSDLIFKFVFPRTVAEKPVVAPEDKHLTFTWRFDSVVTVTFKIKNLMYKGRLEY